VLLKTLQVDCRKFGMEGETAHHIVCECPAIKSIRVRLYGKPLLLPEEVMEEPLWKIARFASETGLLNYRKPGWYYGPSLSGKSV